MRLLYSNILPVEIQEGQLTVADCIKEQLEQSDSIDIAVGYISRASLEELDHLVETHPVSHITLTIGMYYIEGMPESSYRTAMALNEKWQTAGIGEIRLVKSFKYHGKLYVFYHEGRPKSAVIGSANLGVLKLEASNRRQYEVSAITTDEDECQHIAELVEKLNQPICSDIISCVTDMPLVRECNVSLTGVDTVTQLPQADLEFYQRHMTEVSFPLPIKVPASGERFMDDNRHYTKSNLNVCYAAPRSARKPRDWYETQFTVASEIRAERDGTPKPGYPEKNVPFVVVTDDGYTFKCHTTSDNNKQFSAVGDELILGRWIKGRLAAAGLVTPVNDTMADRHRTGMITKEMLAAYGCNALVLTKTDRQVEEDGQMLDVWMLSFEAGAEDDE